MQNTDELRTKKETARYLRVSEASVDRLCKNGELVCTKIGALCRFRMEDIQAMLEKRRGRRA
jgi:excisionase family DNA binding protein